MRSFAFILPLLIVQTVSAQIKITNIDKNELPKTITYKGHIINAVKYTDNEGEHLVITTETGIVNVKEVGEDMKKADLYAYSYLNSGNVFKLSWQMHDLVPSCPVDVIGKYIPGTFAVTDVNNDGKAEVWLMYIITCQGDASPCTMKIIMHSGDKKYAMRGTNQVKLDKAYGGEYTFDDAFKNAPKLFRDYAQQLWKKNILYNAWH